MKTSNAPVTTLPSGKTPAATLVTMSTVEARDVQWLWPGRIPAGMPSLFQGQEKIGKSFVVADLAARISTGRPWPIGVGTRAPSDVILLAHEDARHETVRPRLDAAGADCSRVHLLTDVGGRWPRLPDDTVLIEQAIADKHAALLVIDPIAAYSGDSDSQHEMREALGPLSGVAERTGCAILMIRHVRKSAGVGALHRGMGSVAISAIARAVMMLLPDPDDAAARVLTWPAVNVGAQPQSIRWRFGEAAAAGKPPAIVWDGGLVDLTADDILDRQEEARREPGALSDAVTWLQQQLVGGPLSAHDLDERARGIHNARTLARARAKLGVSSRKVGRAWYVSLPESRLPSSPACGDVSVVGLVRDGGGEERQERQDRRDLHSRGLSSFPEGRQGGQERQDRQPGDDDDEVSP